MTPSETNENEQQETPAIWPRIALGLLIAMLLVVMVWFGTDIVRLYKTGVIGPAVSRIQNPSGAHPSLTTNQIEDWMTFRYLTYVFHLPQGYMATALDIQNPNYQNMTLGHYAKKYGLDDQTFVQSVRNLIAAYQKGA